jgi:hypothetical protein
VAEDRKISEFLEVASLADTDLLTALDASNPGVLDSNVKITIINFKAILNIPSTLTDLDTNVTGSQLNADHAKLINIAEGAEVNVNADWNAVSGDARILNKPTLGTAAAQNVDDFATGAEGDLAVTAVQPPPSDGNYYAYRNGTWVNITDKIINP